KHGRKRAAIHRIHVIDPDHDSTPDGPAGSATGVELKIEVAGANPKAREPGVLASKPQLKAERLIERHRYNHVRGEQRDRADALDRPVLRLHADQTYRKREGKTRIYDNKAASGPSTSRRGGRCLSSGGGPRSAAHVFQTRCSP